MVGCVGRGSSIVVWLSLCVVNFTSASQYFFPWGGTGLLEFAGVGIYLSQVESYSRLELGISLPLHGLDSNRLGSGKMVLLRTNLVKKNKLLGYISKWLLSPPSTWSMREFFSSLLCKKVLELLELKLTKFVNSPLWLALMNSPVTGSDAHFKLSYLFSSSFWL